MGMGIHDRRADTSACSAFGSAMGNTRNRRGALVAGTLGYFLARLVHVLTKPRAHGPDQSG